MVQLGAWDEKFNIYPIGAYHEKGFLCQKPPSEVISDSHVPQSAKHWKTGYLKNKKKRRSNFNICCTLPIGEKNSLINFFEKMGGTWTFRPGRKNGRNHGSAHLGLKIGKIQKTFLLQVFATLWTTDGWIMIFFSDLPYKSQGAL